MCCDRRVLPASRKGTGMNVLLRHRRPMARRLPLLPRPSGRAHAEPRPARRRRGAVRAAFRAGHAVRPVAGLAAHRPLCAEPPLDHQRHAAWMRATRPWPAWSGQAATIRSCSATPTPAPTRAPCRADSPWLRTYEGVAPGFRVELRLPEAEEAYLDHLAERGYGRLTYEEVYGGGFRRPAPFRAEDSVTAFLADRFLGWLDRQGSEPWFAHVVVPQAAPAVRGAGALVLGGRARGRAAARPRRHAGGRGCPAPVARGASGAAGRRRQDRRALLDGASLARLRAVYFGLIAEVDHHLGRILERLARRGELDRTLVMVTSDHGEMLGDHWMLGKAGFFPQAFHVPLLIRQPEGARGRRVTAFTEHVDLMPTVLESLGVERAAPMRRTLPVGFPYRRTAALLARRRALGARFPRRRGRDLRAGARAGERRLRLAVRFDGRCGYVHFAGLPPLCFVDDRGLAARIGRVIRPVRARCWRRRRRCCPGGCARPSGG